VLRRQEAAARHRARARPPAARPLPRRADDGTRPRGTRRDVGGGRAPRTGGGADDPAHDALPRGGRRARGPARDRFAGEGRRRRDADGPEGGARRRRRAGRARRRTGRGRQTRSRRHRRCAGTGDRRARARRARAERRPRRPRDPQRTRGRGDRRRLRVGVAAVARRRLPPLHRARLRDRGPRRRVSTLRHTWFMIVRQSRNLAREPIWIVMMIIQPMIWLLLYGQLFKNVTRLGGFGTGSYVTFLAPAIVVMNAFFGATWSGMSMIY